MKKSLNDLKNIKKLTNKETKNLKGGKTVEMTEDFCEWWIGKSGNSSGMQKKIDASGLNI